jgi:hypothetical protein
MHGAAYRDEWDRDQLLKLLIILLVTPALAQTDQYWQQVCGAKEAQSTQMMVNLLKQLDDANKEIAELKKQLGK